jgi:signal transduction histidine kinase
MSDLGGDAASAPTDPQREKRARLAAAIESRLHDIEQRWVEKVQEDVVRGRQLEPTELRDAIGSYIERLANALRSDESIESSGSSAWADIAREHALTRVRLGFDIDQLVREFILLRRVLFEVAREEHLIANDLQSERLADLIDAAIATSLKTYIESRDLAARREQAEHIGFLTHELRNPLSTAIMAVARLRKNQEIVTRAAQTLDMLDRSLRRLASQIDGLLLTERFDAREMECRPEDVPLGRIVTEATGAAQLEAGLKGVEFVTRFDPELLLHVDPGLTTSALQNVVDNAVKFTDRGRVEITADNTPTNVLVHVYDNCDGLSAEEIKTIFEPFKRAHAGKAGTGLGLAIARRAVEAQGGRIDAESGGDHGCHFWLTLPKPQH